MAKYRKLGRTSAQRKALLRNQVTALLANGKIVTTEAKAKEVAKIAEGLIALAVKEKDNFEMVKVEAKVPVKDKDGNYAAKAVSAKVTVYCGESEKKAEVTDLCIDTGVPFEKLKEIVRVLAVVLFPGAVISVQTAYVSRNLEFKGLFLSTLAASVITSSENVCPRFLPEEFGIQL